MPVAVSSPAVCARCADATARHRAASWTTSTFGRRLRRHHQILRGRSREIALATRASRELNLVPCGDGSSDHLPPGTRVPPSLAKTVVKLPRRDGGVVVVGRERPSDVRLNIGTVSGQHASFERDADGDVYVTDRGSSNGTDVDGRTLKPGTRYKLSVGDVVTLGDPHLARFEVVDAGEGDGDVDGGSPFAGIQGAFRGLQQNVAEAEKNRKAAAEGIRSAREKLRGVRGATTGLFGGDGGGDGGGDAARVDPEDVVLSTIDVDATYDVETVEEPPAPEPERSRSRSRSRSVQPEIVERRDGSLASDARVVFAPVGWPGPAVDLEPGVPVVIGTGLRKGDANLILTGVRGVDSAHASVLRVGGGVYVEDLGSAAGTFVGGRQISPGLQYALTPGASVMLGDGGCAFTVKADVLDDDDDEEEEEEEEEGEGGMTAMTPPGVMGGGGAIVRSGDPGAGNPGAAVVRDGLDVSLSKVDDGNDPAASPWGLVGGLKGMGENLGAAIFNSKIQVNYQYKPEITVGGGNGGKAGLADLKSALLLALADTERGLRADKERKKKIEQLARALEAKNPTRAPLKSPLMNGRWALQYTTRLKTLGAGVPGFLRPKGAIHQTVDIFTLQVKNEESFEPLPFVKFTNSSTSDLSAQTESRAGVKPKDWRVAGIKVDAPPESVGRKVSNAEMEASGTGSMAWMDTTFVDGELRISRSQSGDLYILVRDDPND